MWTPYKNSKSLGIPDNPFETLSLIGNNIRKIFSLPTHILLRIELEPDELVCFLTLRIVQVVEYKKCMLRRNGTERYIVHCTI